MKVQRVEDVECCSVLNRDRLLAALADVMLVRRACDQHDGVAVS